MKKGRVSKKTAWKKKQRDFRKRENKQAGNNKEDNRREYNQTVRHITYDRRQVNKPRSAYNRRATQLPGSKLQGRTEGSPPNRRQLNPQV